jgi:hypothetical protein
MTLSSPVLALARLLSSTRKSCRWMRTSAKKIEKGRSRPKSEKMTYRAGVAAVSDADSNGVILVPMPSGF